MSTFTHRIVWRALPVGFATALIGFGLCRVYLTALEMFTTVTVDESPDGRLQGPIIFGLAGFVLTAAVECARKSKPATVRPAQAATPVAVP